MEGVHAEDWIAMTRKLREENELRTQFPRSIAHQAMERILEMNKTAHARSLIASKVYSKEQIDAEEKGLFKQIEFVEPAQGELSEILGESIEAMELGSMPSFVDLTVSHDAAEPDPAADAAFPLPRHFQPMDHGLMPSPGEHPALPIYKPAQVDVIKNTVNELRLKSIRRPEERLVESHLHTILSNRSRNLAAPESQEKMGIAIYGESGSGKSFMLRRLMKEFPHLTEAGAGHRPFVSVRLKGPVRLQTAGHQIAKVLGGFTTLRFNEKHDYWEDVTALLEELDTVLVHLDEVQDVFITANRLTSESIVSMFKGLMTYEAHPSCLILTGTKAMKPYFETDDAQSPRRLYHVTLPSVSFPADAIQITEHVNTYCGLVGLENGLKGTDYERLMRAGGYQFGRTFSRAIDGIEEALLAASKTLELVHLAHAYQRDRNVPPHKNLFVADDYLRLDPFRTEDVP